MTREEREEFEMDGFRTEAACQFGFETTNDDADEYKCTEAQLLNFAKSCERKGMCDARDLARKSGAYGTAVRLDKQIAEIDAYLKPIVEVERQRWLTARGHVPVDPAKPEGGWVKPPADIPRAPDGWCYELANAMWQGGEYTNWTVHISMIRPCVPPGSIRNLRPLFVGEAESV